MAASFHFTLLLISSTLLFTRLWHSEVGLLDQLGELGSHLFPIQGKATNQAHPEYTNKLCRPNSVVLLMLILAGDIELNPGPSVYPCGYCEVPVAWNNKLFAVMDAAYGTTSSALACVVKSSVNSTVPTYNGIAVSAIL